MTNNKQGNNFADFMSDLAMAVVVALRRGDEGTIEELSDHLAELRKASDASNEPELAAYFSVLHGLLQGEDVSAAAEQLVEPYRAGYERIRQELEESEEDRLSEWLARLTSIVATTTKHGNDAERADVEQALREMAERVPPEDREFHDFLSALRGVLRGKDTRRLMRKLNPPYREAFQSLLQLLATEDTIDFTIRSILDRIEHNTVVALTEGDQALRLAVAEALADVEGVLPEDDPMTPHFRVLIVGTMALLLDRKPHPHVKKLPEPFAGTWQNILAASKSKKK